jgi:hypothetical protein
MIVVGDVARGTNAGRWKGKTGPDRKKSCLGACKTAKIQLFI